MSKVQPIVNAIVTGGNQALAANGTAAKDVPVNTLGYLSIETWKTVTPYSEEGKWIFKHANGDVVYSDIIIPGNITEKVKTPYTESKSKEVIVHGFGKMKCCTEGVELKLEIKNQLINRIVGMLPFDFSYFHIPCDNCDNEDPNDIVKNLLDQINSDEKNFVRAVPVEWNSTTSTWDEIADWDTFYNTHHAANTDSDDTNDVVAGIKIIGDKLKSQAACNAFNLYLNPDTVNFEVIQGDRCSCKRLDVEVTQQIAAGSGAGTEVYYIEGFANGFMGRRPELPYSHVANGQVNAKPLYADLEATYDTYVVEWYDNMGFGHELSPVNFKRLFIFVPTGDATTSGALDPIYT